VEDVKARRRATRISSKNQVTIPVEALRSAGLSAGERVTARATGAGRVLLEREDDVLSEFSGELTGVYEPDELEVPRDEWG
jgi:bifunctional DNA-binding transcriptional regulator/antitoxin component of YhaV-PrlF toxin-antitoxin module